MTLTVNLNCKVVFLADFCMIQARKMNKLIGMDRWHDNLYNLLLDVPSPSNNVLGKCCPR